MKKCGMACKYFCRKPMISQERPSFPSAHQQVLVWVTAVNCWQSWPEPEIGRKVCDSAPGVSDEDVAAWVESLEPGNNKQYMV